MGVFSWETFNEGFESFDEYMNAKHNIRAKSSTGDGRPVFDWRDIINIDIGQATMGGSVDDWINGAKREPTAGDLVEAFMDTFIDYCDRKYHGMTYAWRLFITHQVKYRPLMGFPEPARSRFFPTPEMIDISEYITKEKQCCTDGK